MIKIVNKVDCCGCYACYNSCPKKCINMIKDEEGFEYPKVDESKCIKCKKCLNVCPIHNEIKGLNMSMKKAFACKSKDENIVKNSSSGGMFFELCKWTIQNEGIVFGVEITKDLNAIHSYANTLEECKKYMGSKYIQSNVSESYIEAEKFLKEGKYVLFTGTQCQIKGFKLFLRKDYEKLISVDVICHGVPSKVVFDSHIKLIEERKKVKVNNLKFRSKEFGWEDITFNYEGSKNDKNINFSIKGEDNKFLLGFLKNCYLRSSCYSCKSKKFTSGSDITLGDYWGIKDVHKEFYSEKGVSVIVINSSKGLEIVESLDIDIIETKLLDVLKYNPAIEKSSELTVRRKMFWKNFEKIGLDKSVEKAIKVSLKAKIKNKLLYEFSKLKK